MRLLGHALVLALLSSAAPVVHAAQEATKSTPSPKLLTMSFRGEPWNKVLQWLAEQANLPLVAASMPTGTFTAVLPPGRKLTVAEAIDVVNEGLMGRYRLHRGASTLMLVPADERLDPARIEVVRIDDLSKRGRTEVVRVTLALPNHKPEALLPQIKKLLGPFGEATTLGGRLILTDAAANLQRIVALVRELDEPEAAAVLQTEVIPLTTLQAAPTVDTLKQMFAAKELFIGADERRNALIVRGTQEQIRQIAAALARLGDAPAPGNARVITLDRGTGITLAEALQKMIGELRENPVRIVAPGRKAPPEAKAKDPKGKALPPLTLTVVGNKVIASSDDPELLALVPELTRMLTQPAGDGDFEVIRLRSANAIDVAKVIEDAFNGGQGPGGQPARVRVVAEPVTNALLLKAAPLDLQMIRNLLRDALDTDREDTGVEIRTWMLGPFKNATADDVAKLVREVYRPGGREANPLVAVAADPRTQTVILRCSQPLYREIQMLVQQLDALATPK
jgi:type II secretory pathway component GspD/PulD (secretin)